MAARLAAEPGSKAWGRLSVVVQLDCQVQILFDVAPDSFSPPPKVWSSVLRITPQERAPGVVEPVDRQRLEQVLRAAFSARRKRLGNALKHFDVDWQQAGVSADARADSLGVDEFVSLALHCEP